MGITIYMPWWCIPAQIWCSVKGGSLVGDLKSTLRFLKRWHTVICRKTYSVNVRLLYIFSLVLLQCYMMCQGQTNLTAKLIYKWGYNMLCCEYFFIFESCPLQALDNKVEFLEHKNSSWWSHSHTLLSLTLWLLTFEPLCFKLWANRICVIMKPFTWRNMDF